ncbi:MAG TPA: cellulase family glycosylhydrolase [Bdellovibrionota bacterium]|nr:cellulase family glycosylhydrolase [Bdellovibrionota bacterium]
MRPRSRQLWAGLVWFLAGTLFVAVLSSFRAAATEGWSVGGGFIRDDQGRAVIFRGVNLSGGHKKKPYFDFHQAADFNRIRTDWGMNAVRFLISWAAIEPEEGRIDWDYLDQVSRRLDWADAAGLKVILDMHQDVYGEGFAAGAGNGAPLWSCDAKHYEHFKPGNPWFLNNFKPGVLACLAGFWMHADRRAHLASLWQAVAQRLGSHPAVVGMDPFNEPLWFSPFFEHGALSEYYQEAVTAARLYAPSWLAFLEPSATRNAGLPTTLRKFSVGNAIYSPHSYDTDAESGKGFDLKHRDDILNKVAHLSREAARLGGALWIGEYGGMSARPHIAEYMEAQNDAAGAVAAGSMYWDYARLPDPYAMLHEDGTEIEPLMQVLVRPYAERVAGTPLWYRYDGATRTFTLRYRPDPALRSPLVFSVPGRIYPEGFDVLCSGRCWVEAHGNETWVAPPLAIIQSGVDQTITLRPKAL